MATEIYALANGETINSNSISRADGTQIKAHGDEQNEQDEQDDDVEILSFPHIDILRFPRL